MNPGVQMRGKWAGTLWLAMIALLTVKLLPVLSMDLFGDEAFYWLESRHLALAYSDVPGMTAWLIALGSGLLDHTLGVRAPFLMLGTLTPIAVYHLARCFHDRESAAMAALASLALPLVAFSGVLAIPDVPLNLLVLLLALAMVHCLRNGATGWWLIAGAACGLGFATHYRFAIPALLAAAAVLSSPAGRVRLTTWGPWLALLLAVAGLIPIAALNLDADLAGFRFQLADRHPWRFQAEGVLQPVQQALVTTPLLYAWLAVAGWACWSRRGDSEARSVLLWMGLGPPLFYFVAGLWADQERTTFHWPLAGYLVLAATLPDAVELLRQRWSAGAVRSTLAVSIALGLGVSIAVHLYLWRFAEEPERRAISSELFPDNAVGWSQAAGWLKTWRQREDNAGLPVIGDNFMVAAELSFELKGEPVSSLDHPLNVHHGRAPQLAAWGLDGSAAARLPEALLVVEETALDLARSPGWVRDLCRQYGTVRLLDELSVHGGRKRFVLFRVSRPGQACRLPAFAYLDRPRREAVVRDRLEVEGWAFRDASGLIGVDILVDGKLIGPAHYGLDNPEVRAYFQGTNDPNHPRVGFQATFSLDGLSPGTHWLSVRSRGDDGYVKDHRPQRFEVERQ